MKPLESFLDRLKGVRASNGSYTALCPAHDDHKASLSVREGDDGRTLVKCHVGCTIEDITDTLGLTVGDLFPESPDGRRNGKAPRKIVQSYDYHDAEERLLFQAVRFEPKEFRQRRPDGQGGWTWNLKGVEPVLYRLPEVLRAVESGGTVYAVEGEKDADRLEGLGLTATTCPMGAGKWRKAYSETLRGANVVILPDIDKAGSEHAEQVALSLRSAGANVKVLELSGLTDKGDVSDWLDAGGLLESLIAWRGKLPSGRPRRNRRPSCPWDSCSRRWSLSVSRGYGRDASR